MKIIQSKNKLIKLIHNQKNLGFVPTMGAIHKGHLSLIKKSISQCNKTIVSIYVNKPQFNQKNDFKNYPRVLKKDISILKKTKIDYLYLPKDNQIYHKRQNKKIKIDSFSKKLCGKFRPGHFEAVVDVVNRFIQIINPTKIYLGKKDMQQLILISNFIKENKINVKVVGCKTIRERNGIASSSRNNLLTLNEKKIASKIYKIIKENKRKLIINKLSIKSIKESIQKLGINKIEYIKVFNINSLLKSFEKKLEYKIFISYYLGETRLIDNI